MRSLIITPMLPVLGRSEAGGKHHRAGMFFRALGRISSRVELVHLVPEKILELATEGKALDASQSDFWGIPVAVTLLPRRSRPKTSWTYYGAGIASAAGQYALYPYGGTAIQAGLAKLLDSKPDLVLADRLDAMLAIEASGRRPERLFWDMDDVYHRVLWRAAVRRPAKLGQLATTLQAPALIAAERRAVARSALTFACSQQDATHLARLGFARRIKVVPNAVPIPPVAPGLVADPVVLYPGSVPPPAERAGGRTIGAPDLASRAGGCTPGAAADRGRRQPRPGVPRNERAWCRVPGVRRRSRRALWPDPAGVHADHHRQRHEAETRRGGGLRSCHRQHAARCRGARIRRWRNPVCRGRRGARERVLAAARRRRNSAPAWGRQRGPRRKSASACRRSNR